MCAWPAGRPRSRHPCPPARAPPQASRDRWRVDAVLELPYPCQGDQPPLSVDFPLLPNHVWPSDHLCLAAKLSLLPLPEGRQGERWREEQAEQERLLREYARQRGWAMAGKGEGEEGEGEREVQDEMSGYVTP
jgi:hypothetical protein